MHTCYFLCTNEVLNLGLSNLNHPTGLLLSLALQRCFSAEQMGKRAKLDEWGSIYTPHFKTYPLGSNSAHFEVTGRSGQSDQTRPVSSQRLHDASTVIRDQTLTSVQSPHSNFLLWKLTVVDRTRLLVCQVTASGPSGVLLALQLCTFARPILTMS